MAELKLGAHYCWTENACYQEAEVESAYVATLVAPGLQKVSSRRAKLGYESVKQEQPVEQHLPPAFCVCDTFTPAHRQLSG